MKKSFVLAAIMVVMGATVAFAQPRAIGGRIGYGLEVSYEHSVGSNMVSLEVGVPAFNGLEAAATYDWIDPFGATFPWNERGEWHWYMGVGAAVATNFKFNGIFVGAAGRFGFEYDFWFPLQLSLDFRPTLGLSAVKGADPAFGYDVYQGGIGLGVRYLF